MARMNALFVGFFFARFGALVRAESFLTHRKVSLKSQLTTSTLQEELTQAMDEVLGCGGQVGEADIRRLEMQLLPMWRTLPKLVGSNVDRHTLRAVIHRHFNRRWAINIRGFEPSRSSNASGWGSEDILGKRVPAYVEAVLESQHKLLHGFTLTDAAYMAATVEQLIYDWEGVLLSQIYKDYGKSMSRSMPSSSLEVVLEAYVVTWLLRLDVDTTFTLITNRTQMEQILPQWGEVRQFIRGSVRALQHRRMVAPREAAREGAARRGHHAFSEQYSFEDAHALVGGIRQQFAAFWDAECASLKATLLDMDTHRTGRVPLAKFYGTGMEADWRFGESEAYLRELGALDDSSSWRGKQVLIANYMQAATNCVASTPHYLVCCANSCEPLLAEIEGAVGAPAAPPQQLLAVVRGMSAQSNLDDDFPPPLMSTLPGQLEQIAAAHQGQVPLHSRLFAQWLHYAFPRECAFPHAPGTTASTPPSEYGEDFYASPEEMRRHASAPQAANVSAALGEDNLEWMSQWSPETEQDASLAAAMQAPWEQQGSTVVTSTLWLCSMAAVLAWFVPPLLSRKSSFMPALSSKHHFV